MSPNTLTTPESSENLEVEKNQKVPLNIYWRNVIRFSYFHVLGLYGAYLMFTSSMWQTNVFAIVLDRFSLLGITAGAHRLWTHRSYKAKLPLRIFLACINSMAFQKDIFDWSRDHRVHHKYTETDADPHNALRGFFFSHIGWLLSKKHPEVLAKGKTIDVTDLLADPVVRFQKKHYTVLVLVFWILLPTMLPIVLWGESFWNALFVATMFRFILSLHQTFLVNSAAHMWGYKPYDRYINPGDSSWISLSCGGEGFHNFHHTFPWDYSTSEFGISFNTTTAFINLMACFGQAYDLKMVTPEIIKERKLRTGEWSHHLAQE